MNLISANILSKSLSKEKDLVVSNDSTGKLSPWPSSITVVVAFFFCAKTKKTEFLYYYQANQKKITSILKCKNFFMSLNPQDLTSTDLKLFHSLFFSSVQSIALKACSSQAVLRYQLPVILLHLCINFNTCSK